MTRAFTITLLFALGMLRMHAQVDRLAQRHALISKLYEQERYADMVREVDLQLKEVTGTSWADSLHRYLYNYGYAQRMLKGPAASIEAAERILALVRARGIAAHELLALFDLSWTYYDVGELKQAARVDSLAVRLADSDPTTTFAQRGKARHYLAFVHSVLGDHQRSLSWALAAIEQYEKADTIRAAQWAESYTAAGVANWHLGRTHQAEDFYRQALKKLGNDTAADILMRKASAYGNLGVLWQNAGDLARATNHYQECLRICDRIIASTKDRSTRDEAIVGRSRTFLNLATVYFDVGDDAVARTLLERAWKDRSSVLEPDDPQLIAVKERMAHIEWNAGNLDKAQHLLSEYILVCERRFGDRSEEYVRATSTLGEVFAQQQRFAAADSLYTLSMRAGERSRGTGPDPLLLRTLKARAKLRIDQGRGAEALDDLVRARDLAVRIQDSAHYSVAQVEILMAEATFFMGQDAGAAAHARRALALLNERAKELRKSALPRAFQEPQLLPDAVYWKVRAEHRSAGPTSTAQQFRSWQEEIDLAILALSRNKAAIEDEASKLLLVAAQDRLFDLAMDLAFDSRKELGMANACARFLAMSEAGRSTLLKSRLGMFKGIRFGGLPQDVAAREQELIAALNASSTSPTSLLDLERDYEAFLVQLQREHPVYFALRYGEATIAPRDVRERLLVPGRTLVAYAATDTRLYALVMNDAGEQLILLSNEGLATRVSALNKAIAQRDTRNYLDLAYALHQQVFAPLVPHLFGEELLIIPDGALHVVNFETLLTKPSTATDLHRNLLVQHHAIAYLLSATTAVQFAQLARERSGATLALAPGFTDDVKQRYLALVKDSAHVDRNYLGLVRQPFALRTAEGLSGVMKARLRLGTDATESGFREDAHRYGILHLGTHAEMNATDPMYSRLVLSKDGSGVDPDADGYLNAYEIYELDLRAQLAVLTACHTGTGRNDGEGVRSLGYGFAYAGCPSLVMSLWDIDEQVSSDIISRFYALLADGLPKHQALRQAKLEYLEQADPELRMPYFWAGLVLVGDIQPVHLERNIMLWWFIAGAALLAFAIIWFLLRSKR